MLRALLKTHVRRLASRLILPLSLLRSERRVLFLPIMTIPGIRSAPSTRGSLHPVVLWQALAV